MVVDPVMQTHRDTIEWVTFDAVGTLIYPACPVGEVYWKCAQRWGSKLASEEVAISFSKAFHTLEAKDRQGELLSSAALEKERWRNIVFEVLPDVSNPKACFEELWQHYAQVEAWQVFDDVKDTLEALRHSGVRCVIASNLDSRLRPVVEQLPELRCIEDVFVSSEIGYRKPHRVFFERILNKLGTLPERALHVGDDLHNDGLGPQALGMRSLLVDRKLCEPQLVQMDTSGANPLQVVNTLSLLTGEGEGTTRSLEL